MEQHCNIIIATHIHSHEHCQYCMYNVLRLTCRCLSSQLQGVVATAKLQNAVVVCIWLMMYIVHLICYYDIRNNDGF